MKQLPTDILFLAPESAIAAAAYMEKKYKWPNDGNLGSHQLLSSNFTGRRHWHVRIYAEGGQSRMTWQDFAPTGVKVPSFLDFLKLVEEQPIRIGEWIAAPDKDGVQVGCTHVTWATIEELLKRKPIS